MKKDGVITVWNILNFFDAITTFWVLKFEKVYDVNSIINWLNTFGRNYVFVYFIFVALLVNFVIHLSKSKKIEPYTIGALIFYSFDIVLAVIGNLVLLYEWVY